MTILMDQLETVGSGSYAPDDVHLLLRLFSLEPTAIAQKERLIQSGERHYSDMISVEAAPMDVHQTLYQKTLEQNAERMAREVESLAQGINTHFTGDTLALVSFVRAGLPLGVLLRRALVDQGRNVTHYGISIVRDRGIDKVAMAAIIEKHGAGNIVFVDGWTGKGAIAAELARGFAHDDRFSDPLPLVVLADPCGKAWMAASSEDWIIPSGILGATVSGLVSRTIWPQDDGLHGCVVYDHLHAHDVSVPFIEAIEQKRKVLPLQACARPWLDHEKKNLQLRALEAVRRVADMTSVDDLNRIKPGIAEATRAVLRRVPDRVMVQSLSDPDVKLLSVLTGRAGIEMEEVGDFIAPYRAITVIQKVSS